MERSLQNPNPPPLEPGLATIAKRLKRAMTKRKKEYPPCEICGSPSQDPICPACRIQLRSPLVQREAENLLLFGRTSLQGDLYLVAVYLAQKIGEEVLTQALLHPPQSEEERIRLVLIRQNLQALKKKGVLAAPSRLSR